MFDREAHIIQQSKLFQAMLLRVEDYFLDYETTNGAFRAIDCVSLSVDLSGPVHGSESDAYAWSAGGSSDRAASGLAVSRGLGRGDQSATMRGTARSRSHHELVSTRGIGGEKQRVVIAAV
jgi:hypothetical protein